MLYEALLLFGVVFVADLLFETLAQSRHELSLRHARQVWLFVVAGAYFVFFWCRSGQTLAMKTWRIRLVAPGSVTLPLNKAILRYLLAWMWFLPAIALDYLFELKSWPSLGLIAIGMLAWAATIMLNKERQFLHDQLAGTRLINYPASAVDQTPKSTSSL
jgi:uncharacterized RDD family membrane protein YckC